MNQYNVEIIRTIETISYEMRIQAKSKKEALDKYNEGGFNAGYRLASTYKPTGNKLRMKDIERVKG